MELQGSGTRRLARALVGLAIWLAVPVAAAEDDPIRFDTDVRVRYDGRDRSDDFYAARGRLRVRAGWSGEMYDGLLDWRVRLATNPHNTTHRNVDFFGRTGGMHDTLGLDVLELSVHPLDTLTCTIGRLPFASHWSAPKFLCDGDATVPGVTVFWEPNDTFDLTAGAYFANGISGAHSDPYVAAVQAHGTRGRFEWTAGFYHFDGLQVINFLNTDYRQVTNAFVNLDTDGDGATDTRRLVDHRLGIVRGALGYDFAIGRLPANIGVDVIYNTAASAQNLAYEAQLTLPKVLGGSAWAAFRDCGQNAAFGPWSDAESGEGTGYHSGIEVGYGRKLNDWLSLQACYYHFDRFQPLNAAGARDTDKFVIDLVGKWSW